MAKYALLDDANRVVQVQDDRGILWISAVLQRVTTAGRAVLLEKPEEVEHSATLVGAVYNPDSKTFHIG